MGRGNGALTGVRVEGGRGGLVVAWKWSAGGGVCRGPQRMTEVGQWWLMGTYWRYTVDGGEGVSGMQTK